MMSTLNGGSKQTQYHFSCHRNIVGAEGWLVCWLLTQDWNIFLRSSLFHTFSQILLLCLQAVQIIWCLFAKPYLSAIMCSHSQKSTRTVDNTIKAFFFQDSLQLAQLQKKWCVQSKYTMFPVMLADVTWAKLHIKFILMYLRMWTWFAFFALKRFLISKGRQISWLTAEPSLCLGVWMEVLYKTPLSSL